MLQFPFIIAFGISLFAFRGVSAILINRTIDDFFGDSLTGEKPQYGGPQANIIGPDGDHCDICLYHPDPAQGFNRTFHSMFAGKMDAAAKTDPYTITFTFHGVAVYIVYVLTENTPAYNHVFLQLDDGPSKPFLHNVSVADPNSQPVFIYNQTIFAVTNLSNSKHTVRLTSLNDETQSTVSIFDYAIYTVDDGSIPAPNSVPASDSSITISVKFPPTSSLRAPPAASHLSTNGNSTTSIPEGTAAPSPIPTQPNGSSSSQGVQSLSDTSNNRAVIIGTVIGAIVGAVLVIACLFLVFTRRRSSQPLFRDNIKSFIDTKYTIDDPPTPLPPQTSELDRMRTILTSPNLKMPRSPTAESDDSVDSAFERERIRKDLAQMTQLQQQRQQEMYR